MEASLSMNERWKMHAFDAENEMNRRKAETKAKGDAYKQLADFERPRRRFFLGALLASIGRRLRSGGEQLPAIGESRKMTDQSI